ncbi:MAG: hypothetical protein V7L21_28745 [Nostoc sp.]
MQRIRLKQVINYALFQNVFAEGSTSVRQIEALPTGWRDYFQQQIEKFKK